MSIHFNGKKIKEMYFNGKKISEAYFNGEKVYTIIKGIPVWRFSNQDRYIYLLCEYSTNGHSIVARKYDLFEHTIRSISGVIGQSNSQIFTNQDNYQYLFSKEININGKIFYEYRGGEFGLYQIVVLPNSEVNDTVLRSELYGYEITSLTDSAITIQLEGITVNGIKDKYLADWTREGLDEV